MRHYERSAGLSCLWKIVSDRIFFRIVHWEIMWKKCIQFQHSLPDTARNRSSHTLGWNWAGALVRSFDLAMKHDEWVKKQNSRGAHFKRQLQTALILSVTFIWSPPWVGLNCNGLWFVILNLFSSRVELTMMPDIKMFFHTTRNRSWLHTRGTLRPNFNYIISRTFD
jgi:hypothetical protein